MSPVDTAWLRMDSPANLMMIVGVDVFDGRIDLARLRALLQSHLLQYREFRSRVVRDAAGAWWEEDASFDIDHHLVRVALPGKASTVELQKMVAQLASQSLDPARPLWQMHLVENYRDERPAGDSRHDHALIIRIHHCIADGIALIGVLLSMTTTTADGEPAPPRKRRGAAADGPVWEALLRPFTDATVRAIDVTGGLAAQALKAYGAVLDDPNLAGEAASHYAQVATRVGKDIAALALMDSDSVTSLKGKPGGSKMVAWNEPLPLADVKAVGKALGCSVNDVLLSCAAGAFRSYLVKRGEDVSGAEMRAMVPVNLRGGVGAPKKLGNKFGLVPLLLPIGIEDPIQRVYEVQRRMSDLKGGYMAILAMALLGASGLAPRLVQEQVLGMLARKGTAVMTNVPGPQHPLFMAGSLLKRMMFWVPQSGDIGVGVSILSYDGGVQFGLITDKKLCAHPQAIIDRFAPEFETLVHALLLAPWDEGVDPSLAERTLGATEPLAAAAQHLSHAGNGESPPAGAVARAASGAAPKPLRHPRKRRSAFAAARAS
jgi:WS/DGAT/MGAT family acyltransferase